MKKFIVIVFIMLLFNSHIHSAKNDDLHLERFWFKKSLIFAGCALIVPNILNRYSDNKSLIIFSSILMISCFTVSCCTAARIKYSNNNRIYFPNINDKS